MLRSLSIIMAIVIFSSCALVPSRFGSGASEQDDVRPHRATAPAKPGGRSAPSDSWPEGSRKEVHALDAAISEGRISEALPVFFRLHEQYFSRPESVPADFQAALAASWNRMATGLVFETVSAPPETRVGKSFASPFSVRLVFEGADGKQPVAGVECIVSVGGETVWKQLSDQNGMVSFVPPTPERSANTSVSLTLFVPEHVPFLPQGFTPLPAAVFPYRVATAARSVVTTISLLDFDRNGRPITSGNPSATYLLKPLVQHGFSRIGMADFQKELAAGDEQALLKAAKTLFGSSVQRFIYGTVKIESLEKNAEGVWEAALVCALSAWNFAAGERIMSTEVRHRHNGNSEWAALDAARKTLAGDLLVTELIFSL